MTTPATDPALRDLARHPGVVALVGFSIKPNRPSHSVAAYLIQSGVTMYLVNPMYAGQTALGKTILRSLQDVPEHIHVVDVFRRSEDIAPIIADAIAVKADAVWLQLGISNPVAEVQARDAGLQVIEDRCLAIEYRQALVDN